MGLCLEREREGGREGEHYMGCQVDHRVYSREWTSELRESVVSDLA